MRSTARRPESRRTPGDRTAKARIRDAAIACFATDGVAGATVRKIAAGAGVSPGLVIHHFGSMDGLREACDKHIAASIRNRKQAAMAAGPSLDLLAALRETELGSSIGYLAQVLTEDSPTVAKLVDELVADAERYTEQGVAAGMLQPATDPRGRAVVLTIWSLGALVLHRHLRRLLGVDLTDPDVGADPALAAYAAPVYEIYGDGLVTEDFAAHAREAFATLAGAPQPTSVPPSKEAS